MFNKTFSLGWWLGWLTLTLSVAGALAQSFEMVDRFETHNWHWFQWGDDTGSLTYSTAWSSEGSSALKLTSTKNNTGWNIFGTGCFDTESPDSIKLDVRAVEAHRLEVKIVNSNNTEIFLDAKNMSANTTYSNWKINLNGNNVRKMYLVQAWYSGTVNVYVDNLRTYKNGVETVWDRFETPQYYWDGSADADNKDFEVVLSDDITHAYKSSNFSSTAAFTISWDDDIYGPDSIAQSVAHFNPAKDWSNYYYFRFDVYRPSTTPDCSLFVFIWDGTRGSGTDWERVPANTWTTLTLKMGSNIDMSNIEEIKIVVPNTQEDTSGTLYLDNLQAGGFIPKATAVEIKTLGVPYGVDDFDGRVPDEAVPDSVVREGHNDFFGFTGPAKSDSAELAIRLSSTDDNGTAHTVPFSWKVNYDVSFSVHTWIAYWNLLGPGSEPPPRDMSGMEKFAMWIKGDAADGFSNRITLEFHDEQWGNPGYDSGKAFAVLSGISDEWQQWIVPFDPDSLVIWGTFDPTKLTEVVISLDSSTASNLDGTFYIDDLAFLDTSEKYWNDTEFDVDFLDLVARRTFNYFVECVNDTTGHVRDRVNFLDLGTVAGTGFGLGAMVIGVERGWISQAEAEEYVKKVLDNLWSTPQGSGATGYSGYKGFFYHFLEAGTGLRKIAPPGRAPVELSVVDTAILMAGILTAKEYFSDNATIVELADSLYRRVEWPWFFDAAINQFYLGWSPEGGYVGHWDVYTDEVVLINIMAIGSPTHSVPPNCFYGWVRDVGTYNDHTLINSFNGSLFQYFFAHCWFDLHDKLDAQKVNWWQNSIEAALANRDYCIAGIDGTGREDVPTYSANSWGLTACEAVPAGKDTIYIGGNGALPTWQCDLEPQNCNGIYFGENDGTVPPYGAGSMIGFSAYAGGFNTTYVYDALKNFYKNTQLWTGLYGFRDSYTDTAEVKEDAYSKFPRYKNNFFSIDEGPLLLMIENYRTKLIWQTLAQNEYIQYALNQIFVPDFRVNDDMTGTTQLNPATDANKSGQFVTVWSDRRNHLKEYIYGQKYKAVEEGGTFRVEDVNFIITSGDTAAMSPRLGVSGNGKYMVSWRRSDDVYVKLFHFDSTSALTGETKVNTDPILSGESAPAAVGASEHGDFIVAWTGTDNGKDIYAQRFNNSGTKLGGNFKVNSDAGDFNQFQVDAAMDDSGRFVIVWTDSRAGSGQLDIYGQRYNASGTALGSNFKINGSTTKNFKPGVEMNGAGKFVVTWVDTSSSGRSILAARYDANGTLQGSIISVSSNTYGPAIVKPDVALDSTGAFLVVWQDSRRGSMDTYMQKYTSSGSTNGGNTKVNSDESESSQIRPAVAYLGSSGNYQIVWQDDRNGDWDIYCPVGNPAPNQITEVAEGEDAVPIVFHVSQNYPNPFNPSTTILYSLPAAQRVTLTVFDVLGREVSAPLDRHQEAGHHEFLFDARNLPSGVYFYRLEAGRHVATRKMTVIR